MPNSSRESDTQNTIATQTLSGIPQPTRLSRPLFHGVQKLPVVFVEQDPAGYLTLYTLLLLTLSIWTKAQGGYRI